MKHRTILPKLGILLSLLIAVSGKGTVLADSIDTPKATHENNRPLITFCYQDKELFPNYMGEQKTKLANRPGINIELIDQIALNLNFDVQYVRHSWNRCLALLKTGRVDSLIASYNRDRAQYAVYPFTDNGLDTDKRINTLAYYMYHNSGPEVWNGTLLNNAKTTVAAPLGYSIVKVLRDRGIDVIEAGSPEDVLKLLLYGRVDAIAAPGTTADALIRANVTKFGAIEKDPKPITERPYFIVFSRKFSAANPELTKAVWQQTAYVRSTFRQKLVDKYYNQQYR